jgi:3-hydroxyisobutyrate dehydrogenase
MVQDLSDPHHLVSVMFKISFFGTGLMGIPMAQRLIDQGSDLMAYNRTAAKLAALQGGQRTGDPLEAIDHGTFLFLMLTDAAAIQTTILAQPARLSGKTIIQMGTIAPAESQEIDRQIRAAGGDYLEAPVLGSIPEARSGQLLIMGGARPDTWATALPLLEILGTAPTYIGDIGSAAALKLALNQMIGALTVGFAQSLSYLQAQQVDIEKFMAILRASALYAPTFDKKLSRMVEGNYANPNFPTKHLSKDLQLFADSAAPMGLNLAALQGIQAVLAKAIAAGWAEGDYAAILEGLIPMTQNAEAFPSPELDPSS